MAGLTRSASDANKFDQVSATGFALALARSLVVMRGTLVLRHTERGREVVLTLPAHKDEAQKLAKAA